MGCRGRDLGVAAGRRQAEDGVVRIVERMQDVVRRARMVGFPVEDLLRDRGCPHPGAQSGWILGRPGIGAAPVSDPEQGKRVEGGSLEVVRVRAMDCIHRGAVGPVAVGFLAFAVQRPHRVQVGLFARAGRRCCGQPGQDRTGRRSVLRVAPERVVVGQRLAPIGHGEVRLDPGGGAELLQRDRVPERMQCRDATHEVGLGLL
jgi:hypothetical protein